MKKEKMDKELFLSGITYRLYPERCCQVVNQFQVRHCLSTQGYFIRRGSAAHTMAILLEVPLVDIYHHEWADFIKQIPGVQNEHTD
jgi:hypothetical protein